MSCCITFINTNIFLITTTVFFFFIKALQDKLPHLFSSPSPSYRKSTAKLIKQYQYPDTQKGDVDAFSREPFVVHFQAPKTGQIKKRKTCSLNLF